MMQLALYRAKFGSWLDRTIARLSGGGPFSHVELVFSDGMSFSSTPRDASTDPRTGKRKANGTRWKKIDFDPSHWAFVDLPVSQVQADAMKLAADSILDARYDFRGVLRFALPIIPQHKSEYFCSEATVHVAQAAFLFAGVNAWQVSPNSLARLFGVT